MRKQFKKALSMVLSAAMVLTLGSGFEQKSAKAADTEEWVDTAYTAAKLQFTYTKTGSELGTPVYCGGGSPKPWASEATLKEGQQTVSAYETMTAGWQGNVGWIKNATEGASYSISDVTLTLTTEAGDVVFSLPNATSAASNDGKEPNNVDFPNIWSVWSEDKPDNGDGEVVIESEDGNAKVVLINAKNNNPSLGLQVKNTPADTEAPTTSGSSSAPTTSGSGAPSTSTPPSSEPAPSTSASAAPPETPTLPPEPDSFDAYIQYTDMSWGNYGSDADGATVAEVKGPGKYTVAQDFTKTEDGLVTGMNFVALYIDQADFYHPDRIIRLDEMKVNGTALSADILAKAYTCCDGNEDGTSSGVTRVNLYNGWCEEDDATTRDDARAWTEDLTQTSPWLLEDYIEEDITSLEVSFTYGTRAEIEEVDKSSVETPGPGTSQNPGPGTSQAPNPGTSQAPNPGTSQAPNPGTSQTPGGSTDVAVGTTAKVGTANYKVTGASTAEYSGSTQKNPTSITIPATVKIKGKTFKVTSIKAKAFANKKKLKSVTIGKNIKTIGKQAFFKCAKLKKITFKGTAVTKIGAKAFAKGAKKPTVTTPKKMKKKALKNLKKKLKKAGLNKKAKYKKK